MTLIIHDAIFLSFSVHIKLEEKLNLTAGRDGGLESMELSGMLMLRISDENFGKVKLQLQTPSKSAIQIQPHPNIDKELLRTRSQIAMKNPAKPFPTNTDVGVLKWRFQTTDDSLIPLSSKYFSISIELLQSPLYSPLFVCCMY